MAGLSAPKLPIQNRSTISPPSRPGPTKSPIGPSRRDRRQARWADYTPTQWHESSQSPWPDGYAPPFSMFLQTPPGPERDRPEAQLWPATPTPSGGGAGYGFGVMERPEHLSPMPGDTLSLQPPARVAQMAAAAAQAAAAAGAAAQAAAGAALPVHDIFRNGATAKASSSNEKAKAAFKPFDDRELREEDSNPRSAQMPIGPLCNTFKAEKPGNSRRLAAQLSMERADTQLDDVPQEESEQSWKDEVLPSKGSSTHGSGKCRPCAWFWKPQGCQNDKDCGYCHMCPEGELKNRKKSKVAAMRMGALVPAKPNQKAKCPSARVLKLSPLL